MNIVAIDKLNSLTLTCLYLIREREIEREQEVTVVAIKVFRNSDLKEKYYSSVRNWIPSQQYLMYSEIVSECCSDN
ncbi:MAG: hypothetical protein ACFB15_12795 [Cyclobacteriaceae bacterium]